MTRKNRKEHTITGVIVPEDWDAQDRVIRVAIKTPYYEEYVVEHNKQGKELLALIDEKVKVTGTVRKRVDGDIIISVKSYEPLKESDEGQEDQYKED